MPQRDPAKERHWRRLLRQWRRCGLTVRDFCAEHQLSEPSFYAWRSEIDRRDQQRKVRSVPTTALPPADGATPAFIKLAIDGGASTPAIDIVLSERRKLRVRPGFDADLLRQLVRLLEEPSC
jgi:hypothetical protein